MRKIFFYETKPEPRTWEKTVENINGKIVSRSPWVISELNKDTPKNRLMEMKGISILEEDIEGFNDFLNEMRTSNIKIPQHLLSD